MTTLRNTLLGVATAGTLLSAGVAQAAPSFGVGLHDIFFSNWENAYRTDAACGTTGLCLGAGTGPTGWQMINPLIPGNLSSGDVFAGVFRVQNMDDSLGEIWTQSPGDRFEGYFAQEIAEVVVDAFGAGPGANDHLGLTVASVDPFGILSAGEMFRVYVDDGVGSNACDGVAATTAASIAECTNGGLWASLTPGVFTSIGAGFDLDGYARTVTDLTLSGDASLNETFLAMNILTYGPRYNAGLLEPVNDGNENSSGGPLALGTAVCPPGAGLFITCTQIVGTGEVELNSNGPYGSATQNSPWVFQSNDPLQLYVPEPTTVAMLGMGLVALGMRRRVAR